MIIQMPRHRFCCSLSIKTAANLSRTFALLQWLREKMITNYEEYCHHTKAFFHPRLLILYFHLREICVYVTSLYYAIIVLSLFFFAPCDLNRY